MVSSHFEGVITAAFQDDRARRRRSLSDTINVASISSVAMQEEDSDVVEVRLKNGTDHELETLLNGEVLSFEEQSWMDMKGQL